MSWITILLLLVVLWRMVIGPALHGYRSAAQDEKKEDPPYTDYEELK